MRALVVLVGLIGTANAAPIVGRSGLPELSTYAWPTMDGAAFVAAPSSPGTVAVTNLPALGVDSWFNYIDDGKVVGWMVTGDRVAGYKLVVDDNANGDLADDRPYPLVRQGNAYSVHAHGLWMRVDTQKRELAFETVRRGSVTVDGRAVPFEVTGMGSHYALLSIDNRRVSTTTALRIGTHDYTVRVQPGGDGIELVPCASDRLVATLGAPAPAIEATLADGSHFSLREHRGEIVVLDYWMDGCPPCARERDEVQALSGSATVLSVSPNPTDDKRWPHASDTPALQTDAQGRTTTADAPIATAYDLVGAPDFFVIDREGVIVCAHCRIDEVKARVERLQAPR